MPSQRSVRIVLDYNKLNRYVADVTDASSKKAAGKVAERAKAYAPYRTGRLRASISARKAPGSTGGDKANYLVGARGVPYAVYQEKGTGPIRPVRASVLAYKPKGSSVTIFRPYSSGVPATHFLRRAYSTLSLRDFL